MRGANKSMAINFDGTCKEILGTAVSLGCTVDGKSPKEVQELIDSGEIKCS
jgi:large subunit ribosomal protein L12e